jgi:hypothetical protein
MIELLKYFCWDGLCLVVKGGAVDCVAQFCRDYRCYLLWVDDIEAFSWELLDKLLSWVRT